MGQAKARRPLAGGGGNGGQDVAQAHILAAEHVAFSDHAAFESQQMAGRHIVDVDDVEAAIDVGRYAARGGLDDHPPRGRRLDVAGTHRRGGIDDDNGDTLVRDQTADLRLGPKLGLFVGADHVGEGNGGFLVRRASAGPQAEHPDAAGVDDTRRPGLSGGAQYVAGTIHVGREHGLGIARPQAVIGGDVKQGGASDRRSF